MSFASSLCVFPSHSRVNLGVAPGERSGNVSHSAVSDSAIPWSVACQAPLSVGFSRHEYWNGLPFPSPGDLPNPGIEPGSPALQADSLPTELREAQGTDNPLLSSVSSKHLSF